MENPKFSVKDYKSLLQATLQSLSSIMLEKNSKQITIHKSRDTQLKQSFDRAVKLIKQIRDKSQKFNLLTKRYQKLENAIETLHKGSYEEILQMRIQLQKTMNKDDSILINLAKNKYINLESLQIVEKMDIDKSFIKKFKDFANKGCQQKIKTYVFEIDSLLSRKKGKSAQFNSDKKPLSNNQQTIKNYEEEFSEIYRKILSIKDGKNRNSRYDFRQFDQISIYNKIKEISSFLQSQIIRNEKRNIQETTEKEKKFLKCPCQKHFTLSGMEASKIVPPEFGKSEITNFKKIQDIKIQGEVNKTEQLQAQTSVFRSQIECYKIKLKQMDNQISELQHKKKILEKISKDQQQQIQELAQKINKLDIQGIKKNDLITKQRDEINQQRISFQEKARIVQMSHNYQEQRKDLLLNYENFRLEIQRSRLMLLQNQKLLAEKTQLQQQQKIEIHNLRYNISIKTQQNELLKMQTVDIINCKKRMSFKIQKEVSLMLGEETLKIQKTLKRDQDIRHLFQGDIFEYDNKQKRILMNHIQKYFNKLIIKTRPIYKYDKENKSNFHVYIDGKSSVLLVVKTKNKALLAGYYSGKIDEKQIMCEPGLLISITNNQSYELIKEKKSGNASKPMFRSVVYDKYYMIYGNAELRLKSGEDKIFSNFAIMNAYFDCRKKKVNDFLIQGENRQTEFSTYEFHEVIFSEEKKIQNREDVQEWNSQ